MPQLSELLLEEARRRGLSTATTLTPALAFTLVREMPYRRASDRQPATIIREWRGTCSGKHYLLRAVLAELGLPSTLIACTTYVAADPASLPEELADVLREGPVPDVHNYLRLPRIVDATWPLEAEAYGLPVNPHWLDEGDMLLPCTPLREYVVPDDVDAQEYKNALLQEQFSAEELERRDRFFRLLAGE